MDTTTRFKRLLDADWKAALEENPEQATWVGVTEHDHRWTDWSPAAIAARRRRRHKVARELASLDAAQLSEADRLSLTLLRRQVDEAIEGERFPDELLPVDNLHGVADSVPRLLSMMPASTVADYERILARMRAVPLLIEQTVALLEEGAARDVTHCRIALRDVPKQLARQLRCSPDRSPLLEPFARFPECIPSRERNRLRSAALKALETAIRPAFERLARHLTTRTLPGARKAIDWSSLPDGLAWYDYKVKVQTTTSQSPEELHQLGLEEVGRIRTEMDRQVAAAKFRGGFGAFCQFLRNDPRFFVRDGEALLTSYRDVCKRIEPMLVKLFGRLPRLPYGVMRVPAHLEKTAPSACYQPGSLDGHRPGWYMANTHNLKSRPRWEVEVLTAHEAVPGHHLQIALALELEELPPFRKWSFFEAYTEGWALYAESLGEELGLYRDPYSRMGRLSYEALRACRLVIDTGLHAFGWSRQKALDYLLANSCENRFDAAIEIDRYIAMPAQALAYKVGELAIRRLRTEAAARRREAFDVRAFHDLVLGEGALPLDILERRVRERF